MASDRINVKVGDRERTILIPDAENMGRRQYEEIVEWQTEKTTKELSQPRPERKHSKEEVAGALREYNEWRHKYKGTKKYF